jgi:hypothetical protein
MLSYFWMVYFADGSALAQFDPWTGQEFLWREVEKEEKSIVKAGWYPFSVKLAKLLGLKGVSVKLLPQDRKMEVELGPDCDLVLKRKGHLKLAGSGLPKKETVYILGRVRGGLLEITARDDKGRWIKGERG